MNTILVYSIKLSISFAVIYIFYRVVLRRLTFYNLNRFYLICYTAVSFFIPFINVTPTLEKNELIDNGIVRFIPSVSVLNTVHSPNALNGTSAVSHGGMGEWLLFIFLAGFFVMLIRLVIQFTSFARMISKAQLISDNGIRLYQVNRDIIPFSFGNAIFVNSGLHTNRELEEIVSHEFVHVRQKHTLDIIWAELLCISCWYNPFVWLIRKAIRQNLEFIADNKVLQSGIDKKQYQYLLLKVIGNNHFSIAPKFNFSSLKKRIAMMNKIKSARVHLLKFLFLLPLIAVLTLAFRSAVKPDTSRSPAVSKTTEVKGIVIDRESGLPLKGVLIADRNSTVQTHTDAAGFFTIQIPFSIQTPFAQIKDSFLIIHAEASMPDYELGHASTIYPVKDTSIVQSFVYLIAIGNKKNARLDNLGVSNFIIRTKNDPQNLEEEFDVLMNRFESERREKIKNGTWSIIPGNVPTHDTVPATGKINSKGYSISVLDIRGNCTIVVRDKNQREVERKLLTQWNEKKEHYEHLYGQIPSSTMPSVNLFDPEKTSIGAEPDSILCFLGEVEVNYRDIEKLDGNTIESMTVLKPIDSVLRRYGMRAKHGVILIKSRPTVLRSDARTFFGGIEAGTKDPVSDTINFHADTILWSVNEMKFSFKGHAKIARAKESFESMSIELHVSKAYVLLNGNEFIPDKDYIDTQHTNYQLVNLDKKQAIEKYGDKGVNGAIEITARN